ncbi:glycosyltransferase family 4 protein [Sphingomonas bacterium]|uniref:glycosyltransferase family 4 protein n=1 Tax=Sphingomonas bacterium TaxID=1895847 RepID=UPI0015770DCC|nr:glycosyltransferase family 4 protein [Sphingomonas bacterium]
MPVRMLHLHSTFALGGKEARAVRLMNAWGPAATHTIVSGIPDQLGARARIDPGIAYEIASDPPPLTGRPSVARYEAISRTMRGYDLVLTYNWGAIDGVMARRVFGKNAPPLVHHEDGFNEDEAGGLKRERNLYRRLALPAAHALAVPSRMLEAIALRTWRQPPGRVHRIVNGIDTALYARPPKRGAIPGFERRPGEIVIGALAGLRAVKDLPLLVRAVGGLSGRARLVIVGEGPERGAIEKAAMAMGLGDNLVMPGHLERPYRFVGLFDLLAVSSRSEQFPICVLEAMAAGLPVASMPVGDVATMVAPANLPFVAARRADEVGLRDAMEALARDPGLRASVGAANRAKAVADYDEVLMIARYKALYEDAMGRPGALG